MGVLRQTISRVVGVEVALVGAGARMPACTHGVRW
jgi:hypothetical protein